MMYKLRLLKLYKIVNEDLVKNIAVIYGNLGKEDGDKQIYLDLEIPSALVYIGIKTERQC